MEITKSQKRMFIFLGIVLVYFVYDIITDWDTYAGFYGGKKVSVQRQAVKKQNTKKNRIAEKNKQQYLEKWGRNPFYLKVEKKKKAKVVKRKKKISFQLHAVSMKDNNSVALINDKIVKIGDMISGYTLKKIEKKQVTLSNGQNTIIVKLETY